MMHGVDDPFVAVDRNIAEDAERTEIVYATAMVVMDVRDEDGIDLA